MTAAIINLSKEQVIVAMDTLAVTGATKAPFFFTTKFYPLPHLHGVMLATGLGDFATQWFVKLERFLVRDIHHLDEFVTPALQALGQDFGINAAQTVTIYHVGYSELEEAYVGFAYRSQDDFRSERLGYGLITKPGIKDAEIESYPAGFIDLMEQQREADNALPLEQRACIGGEIQCLILQSKQMTIETTHRFDDYESLYELMCNALPANAE